MRQLIIIAKLPSSPYSQPDHKIYIFLKPSLNQCIFKKYLIDINIIGYFLTASIYGFEVYRYILNTAICFIGLCFRCINHIGLLSPGMWQRESRDRKGDLEGRKEAGNKVCGKRTFEKGEKLGREISIVRMFFKLKVPQRTFEKVEQLGRELSIVRVFFKLQQVCNKGSFKETNFVWADLVLIFSLQGRLGFMYQQGQMITQQKLVLLFGKY